MSKLTRDERAKAAVKSAILELFGADKIDRVEVLPAQDPNEELALSVTIYLRAAQDRISGSRLLDAIAASVSELQKIDDDRVPFVTFLAPEDEAAEDTRPAA